MPASYRVFWDTKVGNTAEEYEDAFGSDVEDQPRSEMRYAVADGATESSYSRHWAQLLVDAYGAGATAPSKLVRRLPALQVAWREEHQRPDLPWFAAEKLALGAFAALLGIRLIEGPDGFRLHAMAAGDCELVVVRGESLHLAWPVLRSVDFGSNPVLLSSVGPVEAQRNMLQGRRLRLLSGDAVLLMTDALAAWFLREAETGVTPWVTLQEFRRSDEEAFRSWARGLRSAGAMRNDDVTLAILDVT
jgi:hypothetical protein